MRILEEFWYGNIEPMEYGSFSNEEYKELLRLITKNEEKLQATFSAEQKELFSKYQSVFRSFRRYQSACCSRTASVWEQK